MLVVPLKKDKIETKDGVIFTVLSYTNYREKGPAVYVEHTPGVPSDAVYFFDINKINGVYVDYVGGSKVFKAAGRIDRTYHLPQVDDIITVRGTDGSTDLKVIGLKLHKRDSLAKGLIVQAEDKNDPDSRQLVRLDDIVDLQRNIGSDARFSRDAFLKYYGDYRGIK